MAFGSMKMILVVLVVCCIVAAPIVAAVVFKLGESNVAVVDVGSKDVIVPLVLTGNFSGVVGGDTLRLIATADNAGVAGFAVSFYDNGTKVGSGVLAVSGSEFVATYDLVAVSVGRHNFKAGV